MPELPELAYDCILTTGWKGHCHCGPLALSPSFVCNGFQVLETCILIKPTCAHCTVQCASCSEHECAFHSETHTVLCKLTVQAALTVRQVHASFLGTVLTHCHQNAPCTSLRSTPALMFGNWQTVEAVKHAVSYDCALVHQFHIN